MTDHIVMPMDSSQKPGTIDLLTAIARFALRISGGLERDLDARFVHAATVSFSDAVAWLTEVGVKSQPLDASAMEVLHTSLQQGNDSSQLQLLAIGDASKLIELEDNGETQLSPRPFWNKTESCMLLRYGYSVDQPFAYYCASLPGDSKRPIRLTWESIGSAGISAAEAIFPASKKVDAGELTNALHIMDQALQTATNAHRQIMAVVGQRPAPTEAGAPAQPVAEQAV